MSDDLVSLNENPKVNAFNLRNFRYNTTIPISEEIIQFLEYNLNVDAFNHSNFGDNTTIGIGEGITQNIDNSTTLFQTIEAQTNINALKELINRTNELFEEDEEYRDFIHELNSLLEQRSGREIIGTEQKLLNGDRQDLIEDSWFYESKFARKLAKGELSRTSQAIFLHCLSTINEEFLTSIRPLIEQDADKLIVNQVIEKNIIDNLYGQVSSADSSITKQVIRGMLYFLTGKCHIKWEK